MTSSSACATPTPPASTARTRTRAARRRFNDSALRRGALAEALGGEQLGPQFDAEVLELLGEARPDARGLQLALEAAALVDAHAEVEQEDVLEGDDVALHALHLRDVRDAAGAVAQTAEMHDQVEGGGHLL